MVLVNKATEEIATLDLGYASDRVDVVAALRSPKSESTMRSLSVVVASVASKNAVEVPAAEDQSPVEVDHRKLRRVALHHWSWIDLLTEAIVQKTHRGVSDPDQAYILGELIRYLSDDRSGAVAFDGMGPSWTAVRDGAREQTLRKGDPGVAALASRWDDLLRYLALTLTADLGRQVAQILPAAERTPAARRQALVDRLVTKGDLYGELQIPDAAGPLTVVADLRARQVVAGTAIEAPREGTSKGRVSWLLRQLQDAPDALKVESRLARSSSTLVAPLSALRETPSAIYPDKGKEIRGFLLSLSANMGLKRATGQGSFVDSVLITAESFYATTLQNLRSWKPGPPQLRKQTGEDQEGTAAEVAKMVGVAEEAVATEYDSIVDAPAQVDRDGPG